jgi:hypothetical protein
MNHLNRLFPMKPKYLMSHLFLSYRLYHLYLKSPNCHLKQKFLSFPMYPQMQTCLKFRLMQKFPMNRQYPMNR